MVQVRSAVVGEFECIVRNDLLCIDCQNGGRMTDATGVQKEKQVQKPLDFKS